MPYASSIGRAHRLRLFAIASSSSSSSSEDPLRAILACLQNCLKGSQASQPNVPCSLPVLYKLNMSWNMSETNSHWTTYRWVRFHECLVTCQGRVAGKLYVQRNDLSTNTCDIPTPKQLRATSVHKRRSRTVPQSFLGSSSNPSVQPIPECCTSSTGEFSARKLTEAYKLALLHRPWFYGGKVTIG